MILNALRTADYNTRTFLEFHLVTNKPSMGYKASTLGSEELSQIL